VKLCVGYTLDGKAIDRVPSRAEELERCEPVYETLPGWAEDASGARSLDVLPGNMRAFLSFVARATGCPVTLASVGPGRDETVEMQDPFGLGG